MSTTSAGAYQEPIVTIVRAFLHGPIQIATRVRLKSPPESDPNRHLIPMVIAT